MTPLGGGEDSSEGSQWEGGELWLMPPGLSCLKVVLEHFD